MNEKIASLQRQIDERERNIRLIDERMAKYALETDIPLQLIKEKEDQQKQLASLQAEIDWTYKDNQTAQALPSPSGPAPVGSRLRLLGLVTLGVVVFVGFLAATRLILTPSPTPTLPPTVEQVVAATDSTPTPAHAISRFPPLPSAAPLMTTTLILAYDSTCAVGSDALAGELQALVATDSPPTAFIARPAVNASAEARALGQGGGANLVAWCQGEADDATSHFEILSARGAPEVFEPAVVSLHGVPPSEVARIHLALASYLRRDYAQAAKTFATLGSFLREPESQAWMLLLQGNSLIYQREYTEAAEAYAAGIALAPDSAPLYHNLGVAQMYQHWEDYDFEPAQASFAKALELDPHFGLTHVARGYLWKWLGSVNEDPEALSQAEDDCQQAAQASEAAVAAQGTVCLARLQFLRRVLGMIDDLPPSPDSEFARLATPAWSTPLVIQALSHYLLSQDQNDRLAYALATKEIPAALEASFDDVHLEETRPDYAYLVTSLDQLTK